MAFLTAEQIAFFDDNGYLIVDDVLDEADIAAVRGEYAAILDRELPGLKASGKIADSHDGLDFEDRYAKVLPQLDHMYDLYQHLDISLPLISSDVAFAALNSGPAIFSHILRNPAILDIAESLLGPEIDCNPVQHTRIKPPRGALPEMVDSNVAATGWHQDEAVLTDDVGEIDILTVWVAMTDATEENGCMVCVPGSHRGAEPLAMHCPGNSFSSAEIFIPPQIAGCTRVPMPVGRGGVVLLHQRTVHGSLENESDSIRWSFDLRYNVAGQKSGRAVFPSFLARSRANPTAELTDPAEYAAQWQDARDRLAEMEEGVEFNDRWKRYSSHPLCA